MAAEPSSGHDFKGELDAFIDQQPLPLVALVGQRDRHGILTERKYRPDELRARYISLEMDTTALDYHPGASDEQNVVLKRDWLHKHTHVIAAVVALWFAWDNDTSTAGFHATVLPVHGCAELPDRTAPPLTHRPACRACTSRHINILSLYNRMK